MAQNKTGLGTIGVAIAGAALGAAAAVLSDKKKRNALKKTIDKVAAQSEKRIEQAIELIEGMDGKTKALPSKAKPKRKRSTAKK